eukprot:2157646-Prymnesium_polylepis.1
MASEYRSSRYTQTFSLSWLAKSAVAADSNAAQRGDALCEFGLKLLTLPLVVRLVDLGDGARRALARDVEGEEDAVGGCSRVVLQGVERHNFERVLRTPIDQSGAAPRTLPAAVILRSRVAAPVRDARRVST